MKGTKGHRERKNGASHEQWMERKAAANAARPTQVWTNIEWRFYGWIGRKYLEVPEARVQA